MQALQWPVTTMSGPKRPRFDRHGPPPGPQCPASLHSIYRASFSSERPTGNFRGVAHARGSLAKGSSTSKAWCGPVKAGTYQDSTLSLQNQVVQGLRYKIRVVTQTRVKSGPAHVLTSRMQAWVSASRSCSSMSMKKASRDAESVWGAAPCSLLEKSMLQVGYNFETCLHV